MSDMPGITFYQGSYPKVNATNDPIRKGDWIVYSPLWIVNGEAEIRPEDHPAVYSEQEFAERYELIPDEPTQDKEFWSFQKAIDQLNVLIQQLGSKIYFYQSHPSGITLDQTKKASEALTMMEKLIKVRELLKGEQL